jgi:hypothetical protein
MFFIAFVMASIRFGLTNQRVLGSTSNPNMGAVGVPHGASQGAGFADRGMGRKGAIFLSLDGQDFAGLVLG